MSSETFTCITCRLIFNNGDAQRTHYRTAWHCFNLKRKVAGLAPVSQEVFDLKVQALRSETAGDAQPARKHQNPKKMHKFSKGKNRNKGSNMSAVAMEFGPLEEPTSKSDAPSGADVKGKQIEKQQQHEGEETPMTEEEMIAERLRTAKPVPTNESLFDGYVSKDIESNLEYMRRNFGFFVPEVEALNDLEGLIAYLGEKVGIGYTCLYCEKSFHSLVAVRSHMVDVGHCKIKFYESLEEFEDFYNLGEESDEEESETTENADEQGRSTSSTSTALIVQKDLPDSWTPGLPLSDSSTGSELILPSGATVGHRALRVYYRQRTRPQETRQSVLVNQLIRQYNELGYLKQKREAQRHSEISRYQAGRREHLRTKMQLKANKLPMHMHHKECMT